MVYMCVMEELFAVEGPRYVLMSIDSVCYEGFYSFGDGNFSLY